MNELNENRTNPRTEHTLKSRFLQHNDVWTAVALVFSFATVLILGFLARAHYSTRSTGLEPPTMTLSGESGTKEAAPLTAESSTPVVLYDSLAPNCPVEPPFTPTPGPNPTPVPPFFEGAIIYGTSYGGRSLEAYRLGYGPSPRAVIGGIHGGYEWNTVDIVSDTLSYFQQHQREVPPEVTLYIIPCSNPDGYVAGTDAVSGRMNGNGVDLNRNWGHQWQVTATHGTRPVNAGDYAFSEPETAYLRDFILNNGVELAIFYHSALGGVIFSGEERTKSATYELAEMLAPIIGYRHQPEGIPSQITTGDAIDWLSTQGVATVQLELTTHERVGYVEWQRNLAGIRAFLNWSLPRRVTAPRTEDVDE